MTKFIDIHTHSHKESDAIEIRYTDSPLDDNYFISGVHPWSINKTFKEDQYLKLSEHKNFFALGEIGLDRLRDDFLDQKKLFTEQVKFAVQHNINILIVHNVKATQDIIEVLSEHYYNKIVIMHDFNISKEAFEQLNRVVEVYAATGHSYIKSSKTRELYRSIPKNRVLFETVDKEISIKDVYRSYSEHSGVNLEELKSLVYSNFTNLLKSINIEH